MNAGADYDRALSITRKVLREWDPYSLVAGGAPNDEFDSEAAEIVTLIPQIHSAADAAAALSQVFSEAFSAADFSGDACASAGAKLFARLSEAGLV
jgi:hypothetical protein